MLASRRRRDNGGRYRHGFSLLLSLSPGLPLGQRFGSGRQTIA
jgi:hypothetical protein